MSAALLRLLRLVQGIIASTSLVYSGLSLKPISDDPAVTVNHPIQGTLLFSKSVVSAEMRHPWAYNLTAVSLL